jgi:hypothetical protein
MTSTPPTRVRWRRAAVWTPRDTPEPGLRIAFVADPDGNLVELLSSDGSSSDLSWARLDRGSSSATHERASSSP